MNETELAAIEARWAATSPGTWNVYRDADLDYYEICSDRLLACISGRENRNLKADACFMGQAHQDVAALLADARTANRLLTIRRRIEERIATERDEERRYKQEADSYWGIPHVAQCNWGISNGAKRAADALEWVLDLLAAGP